MVLPTSLVGCLQAELFIDDKAVLGIELLAMLNEKPVSDNYIYMLNHIFKRKC